MPHTLLHMPLESYKQRYTEYLHAAEAKVFSARFKYSQLTADDPDDPAPTVINIRSGQVLDRISRPVHAMRQMEKLLLSPGRDLGRIYFSDFFHPGLEALPYSGKDFQASAFCWAQTFDGYDFTVPMAEWMRPWEIMAFSIYHRVFVASTLLEELIRAALPNLPIEAVTTVGLPFDSKIVGEMIDLAAVGDEKFDVVYSSRWDSEKSPTFFLEVVQARPDLKFLVCTGHDSLRGTDQTAVHRAKELEAAGRLIIRTGLTKGQYFALLQQSKVQFNCALQDWVSFTLLEALTFGCMPLYPNHRSFPEALLNSADNLYRPFDLSDALGALDNLLSREADKDYAREILGYHDGTIGRIAELL